ncbi:quaternary ammonium compound-resistance protein SugE [Paenibacillus cellulosilyticus]|uniref:Quaternary ammonium compound-resistance protein SugE n=1 Tax=Paenibacillus cellulosilyticus TaxID=375489 RepID=A0A2V2YZC1_9BACL|nr:multidrug efflux SMR transporter [Paenibacillus cellulosilyticus]PWW08449.1 quaternary ammonium compound-resistance protein SugE [Paenibacillus cellulosilyticus]QKS48036.1 multidrug efflux SMR transporter [Paenibacillus cellulosilyticus]
MAWLFLLLSGLGEVSGVTFTKLSDGFRKWKGTVGAIISGIVSFYCLSQALRDIPISTAYGIWTGIGSAGSVLLGMFVFGESKDWRKLLFIGMIIVGVIGLKISGASH